MRTFMRLVRFAYSQRPGTARNRDGNWWRRRESGPRPRSSGPAVRGRAQVRNGASAAVPVNKVILARKGRCESLEQFFLAIALRESGTIDPIVIDGHRRLAFGALVHELPVSGLQGPGPRDA